MNFSSKTRYFQKLKYLSLMIGMTCLATWSIAKTADIKSLNDNNAMTEAEMRELLIEYYPVQEDISKVFKEKVKVFNTEDELIYEGEYDIYGSDVSLEELLEQSDFLIYTQDTAYYILDK